VTADRDALRARRYLLGEGTDEERLRVEQEYFADAAVLDRLEAEEEALVEDYASGDLSSAERRQFEREMMSVPGRRARVAIIRALIAAARGAEVPHDQPASAAARRWFARPFALAAAAIVILAAGIWSVTVFRRAADGRPLQTVAAPSAPTASARAAHPSPRIVAVSLFPDAVRSAGAAPAIVVPDGTDLVQLNLGAEPGGAPVDRARAVIRTVAGEEVWTGSAAAPSDLPAGVVARVDVPAARLRADDYVLTLFTTAADGVERERDRYYMRVRGR
jgi:hypothetical protein